jgi:hypothetical protein
MEERVLQFQAWITGAHLIDRPELYVGLPESVQKLTDWAARVSEEELEPLIGATERFLTDIHINLTWLLDGSLDQLPELKEPMEEAVALFALAYLRASRLADPMCRFVGSRSAESRFAESRFAESKEKDTKSQVG